MTEQQCNAPRTGVVILNWNGEALLREFLPSVVEHTRPEVGTVIVADNGSTDDSLRLLRREFPSVEILAFSRNHGFAQGYNLAIKELASRFEYILLLNSDVKATANYLEPLVAWLDEHPAYGAVQPKLLSYREPQMFEYAGACGGYLDRHGYPYCRGRIFDVCERDNGQYDTPADVFWATGAALLVRSKAYIDCGGLDPDFFAHMEEIDLCWRMQLAGWKLAAVPQSTLYHLGGGSLPASNPRKTYLNFRNNLLMLHKNIPHSCRTRLLLERRLLDTVAWAKFVATFDWKNAGAVWRAHRDFARMRHNYSHMQGASANLLAAQPQGRLSILKQFFLNRKKRYSDLPL